MAKRKTPSIKKFINKVFHDDIMNVLAKLPDNSIDMIYGDPDYNVNINYAGKNYTTEFDGYIDWYVKMTEECMRVLKEDGNIMMMNYSKPNAHLRVKYLDDVADMVEEYVWTYNYNFGIKKNRFTRAHRSILHITKSKDNRFYRDNVAEEYKNPTDKRVKKLLDAGSKGRMPYSWFYHDLVKNVSKEKSIHAAQIPKNVSRKLIECCTMPGDTVLVLFGGSGSECEVCKEGGRNYISAELHETYHDLIVKRLEKGEIPKEYWHKSRLPRRKKEAVEDEKQTKITG